MRLKMATIAEQAEKLLDFTQKFDIHLLDTIVSCMYTADGEQVYTFYLYCLGSHYYLVK